jgi:hypothetical protein
MTEASIAMCVTLLAAKGREFVGRHRSFSSALASAKRKVQQQLADGEELAEDLEDMAEEGAEGKEAAGRGHADAPATAAADNGKHRTPTTAGGRQAAAPEVSPLVQRGEAAWGRGNTGFATTQATVLQDVFFLLRDS